MSKPSRRASRAADRSTGRSAGGSFAGDPSSPRAGRRERPRASYYRRSFFDRYRSLIFGIGGLAVVAVVVAFVFFGSTAKTYACSNIWQPNPTSPPAAGASPQLGYVQQDQGRLHDATSSQRYTNCPPASGSHTAVAGKGPIQPRVYGPDDFTEPQGWIHNLEHGALVLLYKCQGDACTDAGQAQLRQFYQSFPASPVCHIAAGQIGPVVARFDDMAWPYAAMVWDRVLPLQSLDTAQILAFYQQWGEKTNPEPQCQLPSASPGASGSAAPSSEVPASVTPSAGGSTAPGSASPAAS